MTHRTPYVRKTKIPWTCFSEEQLQHWLYWALLNDLFTDLPKLTKRTETLHLLLQWLYLTLRAPLKPSHGSYSPTTTLRHLLTNVKDRDEPNNREGAVYKMKCSECQTSYIDETGRNLNTRLTEHKRTTRNGDANNHIALHHQLTSHNFPVLNLRNELFSTTDSGKLAH